MNEQVNLLNCEQEPSDEALSNLMHEVASTAKERTSASIRSIQEQTKAEILKAQQYFFSI